MQQPCAAVTYSGRQTATSGCLMQLLAKTFLLPSPLTRPNIVIIVPFALNLLGHCSLPDYLQLPAPPPEHLPVDGWTTSFPYYFIHSSHSTSFIILFHSLLFFLDYPAGEEEVDREPDVLRCGTGKLTLPHHHHPSSLSRLSLLHLTPTYTPWLQAAQRQF